MPHDRLCFFVDPSWRRSGYHIPLLNPFWGTMPLKNSPFVNDALTTYGFDPHWYAISNDVEKADVILLPYRYQTLLAQYPDILGAALTVAGGSGKRVVIDATGDIDYDISIPEAIILKYGGYRFLKKKNEIIIPLYADDLLERFCGGVLTPRPKDLVLVVGFAGWAETSFPQRLYWRGKEIPLRFHAFFDDRYRAFRKGIFFRREALRQLTNAKEVRANVITRPTYSGNVHTVAKDSGVVRGEFIENALASDLCLDIRGDANASTRLFEILSLGRIPLIIDTERNFPFSEQLDYQSFSIIIDFRDLENLPHLIRTKYDTISEDQWIDMQERARSAYRNWFRPDALTSHLVKELRKHIF
ncbi:MAG: exostosin family protein [Minisyncoccia bacterium]